MKKILVAVDGSDASLHAARFAHELARGVGAELTLAHVAPPIIMPVELPIVPAMDLRAAALAEGAAVLERVRAAIGAPVQTLNLYGLPAEALADVADGDGFELVVVGNKGRGAVSRVLLGSVADRLVHICKRPVLVVR